MSDSIQPKVTGYQTRAVLLPFDYAETYCPTCDDIFTASHAADAHSGQRYERRKKALQERTAEMVRLSEGGLSFREIGCGYRISAGHARQIIKFALLRRRHETARFASLALA